MTTSAKTAPRARRLASGPQLYVLNRAGRLQLREPELENEITSERADFAIRRSIEDAADVEGPAEADSKAGKDAHAVGSG